MESKRARIISQDKPDSSDTDIETEANLDTGKRFVNSLILFFCLTNAVCLYQSDTSEPLLMKIIEQWVSCLTDD